MSAMAQRSSTTYRDDDDTQQADGDEQHKWLMRRTPLIGRPFLLLAIRQSPVATFYFGRRNTMQLPRPPAMAFSL